MHRRMQSALVHREWAPASDAVDSCTYQEEVAHPTVPRAFPYALSRHAFACMHGGDVVILDLRQDKYLALGATYAAGLASLILGWPSSGTREDTLDERTMRESIGSLLERGLLVENTEHTQSETDAPATVRAPGIEWIPDIGDKPRVTAKDILRFTQATTRVALALRYRPLEQIINGIKRRHDRLASRAQPLDEYAVRRLVATFGYLRPYFTSAKDACLFESLALQEFLFSHRFDLHLVFGVRTGPFHAHCWLQHGEVVVNDAIDSVSRYTPIMIV